MSKMTILLVEAGRHPVRTEIMGDLASMQRMVGGPIQAVYPFQEAEVALICNEEGKLDGLPLNRVLRDVDGNVYDVIAGTFFLCGAPPSTESFTGLSEEQLQRYEARFWSPEVFMSTDTGVICIEMIG